MEKRGTLRCWLAGRSRNGGINSASNANSDCTSKQRRHCKWDQYCDLHCMWWRSTWDHSIHVSLRGFGDGEIDCCCSWRWESRPQIPAWFPWESEWITSIEGAVKLSMLLHSLTWRPCGIRSTSLGTSCSGITCFGTFIGSWETSLLLRNGRWIIPFDIMALQKLRYPWLQRCTPHTTPSKPWLKRLISLVKALQRYSRGVSTQGQYICGDQQCSRVLYRSPRGTECPSPNSHSSHFHWTYFVWLPLAASSPLLFVNCIEVYAIVFPTIWKSLVRFVLQTAAEDTYTCHMLQPLSRHRRPCHQNWDMWLRKQCYHTIVPLVESNTAYHSGQLILLWQINPLRLPPMSRPNPPYSQWSRHEWCWDDSEIRWASARR